MMIYDSHDEWVYIAEGPGTCISASVFRWMSPMIRYSKDVTSPPAAAS